MWFKFSGTEVVSTTQDWGYKFDVKVSDSLFMLIEDVILCLGNF
jgi:hypothetical protein